MSNDGTGNLFKFLIDGQFFRIDFPKQAEENNTDDDETDEADCEASEKLIEYAGDVLPALGGAMSPDQFAPYFAGLLPSILLRSVSVSYFHLINYF